MKKFLNATSEFTIGDLRAHRGLCRTVAGVSSFLMLATFSAPALAAGTSVLGGDATLTDATRAALNTGSATDSYAQLVADAGAKSAVLDWSKFNIGAGKEMNFSGAGTTFFNLVDGAASKSQIDGLISGNGSVWVINPSGIAFGANSQVNVGGTFAAAAGNLSNADALRDGTATLPTFSSFDGSVSSASGSKFTADQVTLLGKTVSAAGDFTGVKDLVIGAADKLTVDEVAGGRISVSVSDFASEGTLQLGDLVAGGATKAVARGDATVGGTMQTQGNVQIFSKAGGVTVASGATVETSGTDAEIDLVAGMAESVTGDVTVDGTVKADAGEVYLHAGYGTGSSGLATVNGTVSAGGAVTVFAGNNYGVGNNVTVAGAVSAGGKATVGSYDGSVALSDGKVTGGDGVSVSAFAGVSGTGAIDASGKTLSVNGGIGNVILDGVSIKAKDATLSADDYIFYGSDYAGAVSAKNTANDFTGTVTARGSTVSVLDANDLALGDVKAYVGGVTAYSGNGDVSVVKDASVQSVGTVDLAAGMYSGAVGGVRVTGDISSSGGDVSLYSGYGAGASGDVTIDGNVTAARSVDAYAGFGYAQGTAGKLSVNGNVTAGSVYLRTGNGDIAIGGNAVVKSDAASYGLVYVYTAADAGYGILEGAGHSGNIVVDGALKADGTYGMVDVVAGKEVGATGSVTLNGSVSSDYYSELATRTGSITVNGTVESLGNVNLDTESGTIELGANAKVKSLGGSQGIATDVASGLAFDEMHSVGIYAAMKANGKGDIKTAAGSQIASEGSLGYLTMATGFDGTAGTYTGGDGNIAVQGSVSAENALLHAKGGTATVESSGAITAESEATITADDDIAIAGSVTSQGSFTAVSVNGGITASGKLDVRGDVTLRSTKGALSADNAENHLGGTTVAEGSSVNIAAKDGLTLGHVEAYGEEGTVVAKTASGELKVLEGLEVYAPSTVTLLSGTSDKAQGKIVVNGTVTSSEVLIGNGVRYAWEELYYTGSGFYDYMPHSMGGDGSVEVNGTVSGATRVMIGADNGDVTISKSARVTTSEMASEVDVNAGMRDGTVDWTAGTSSGAGAGNVIINGTVSSGDYGITFVNGGYGIGASGDVAIDGTVSAGALGGVYLHAGYGYGTGSRYGSSGKLTGAGTLSTDQGYLEVTAVGDIALSGKLSAKDAFANADGSVSIANKANDFTGSVSVGGKNVSVADANDIEFANVRATGKLEVSAGGNIEQQKDMSVMAGGTDLPVTLVAGGDVNLANEGNDFNGHVSATGRNISLTDADSLLLGEIQASKDVTLVAKGSVVGDDAITAGGDLSVSSSKGGVVLSGVISAHDVSVQAANNAQLSNDANTFNGTVSAKGQQVSVHTQSDIVLGDIEATDKEMYVITGDGDISVGDGKSVAGKTVVLLANNGGLDVRGAVTATDTAKLEAYNGDIHIAGTVAAAKNVLVKTTKGSVAVDKGAVVRVSDAHGAVQLASSAGDGAKGDVVVNGLVSADGANGRIDLLAGNGKGASGDVMIGATGVVQAKAEEGQVFATAGLAANNTAVGSGNVSVLGQVAADDHVLIHTADGSVAVGACGTVSVSADDGTAHLATGYAAGAKGGIDIQGGVSAGKSVSVISAMGAGSRGDVSVSGSVEAGDNALVMAGYASEQTTGAASASGNMLVSGTVTAKNQLIVGAGNGDVAVSGTASATSSAGSAYVAAGLYAGSKGDINVSGRVTGNETYLLAGVDNSSSGNLRFTGNGSAVAKDGVYAIVKNGDLTQEDASVTIANGRAEWTSLKPVMSADTVNLVVYNGSIGSGQGAYVAIDGKTYANADGDVAIAAANGANFKGGPGVGTKDTQFGRITFGDPDGNSNIKAGGDISIYTAGEIESSGLLQAGGDLTVSAASFGDISYLRADGTLTINNVGKPAKPQIAYFETVNGVEPNINNQPNDTVIFVDGRLAGGNLKILNQFGANEAFMVSTPELKSTQGIFGNPTFLHSDLDVANPMEVSAIDYMLQETPRLTLDKDFPAEVDQHVDSVVVPERDSIQFGRETKDGAVEGTNGKVASVK